MRILSILPLTDSFTDSNAGAASLFIKEIDQFNKKIIVAGSIKSKNTIFKKRYINFSDVSRFPKGKNYSYAQKIYSYLKSGKEKFDIIEVHNRPQIAKILLEKNKNFKIILYLHNNPNDLRNLSSPDEKLFMLKNCAKIIFLSEWIKDEFFINLNFKNSDKTSVLYPVIKSNLKKEKKRNKEILFVGKLNSSKGYDLFCKAAESFLKKNKEWNFLVCGDEPRENIVFKHQNFFNYGWLSNKKVNDLYKRVSIVIVPSKWKEPLGRVPIEASKNGAVVISSDKGGLLELSPFSLIDRSNSVKGILKILNKCIKNKFFLSTLNKLNKNYKYERSNYIKIKKKLNEIRKQACDKKININFNHPVKILHITDSHIRHFGRLFYSTGKKLSNGFLLNNYNLQSFSDRDIQSYNKSYKDMKGSNYLNNGLLNFMSNFRPDILLMGHADNITNKTLTIIKSIYPGTKLSQWFLDPLIKSGPDYVKNTKRLKLKFNLCDSNFITTSPKVLNFDRKKTFFLPNPVDYTIDCLDLSKNPDPLYDVFIAISHGQHRGILKKGKVDIRFNEIKEIIKSDFVKTNLFGFNDREPVWGDNFFNELKKCSMGINLSRGEPIKWYSSDRIASLMGNGLLTFVKKKYFFSDFFNKNEIIFYDETDELLDKIIYYKKNYKERSNIAKNGRNKYFKLFNNKIISKYIVDKTLGLETKIKW